MASGYDHPMLSWFDSTATVVAQASRLVDGERALDLATGTGKVSNWVSVLNAFAKTLR